MGSSLALHLQARLEGVGIVCADNLKRRGSELNRQRIESAGIGFVHLDVRSAADFDDLVGPFDAVIDACAEPSVLAGLDRPSTYVIDTNLMGTVHALNAAHRWGAQFIFLSTSRVYSIEALCRLALTQEDRRFGIAASQSEPGITSRGIAEGFPVEGYRSLYGTTKLASELIVAEYAQFYGLPTTVLRCGVLAGPWQMGRVDQGFVVLWLARHLYGGRLSYIGYGGSGHQVRDVLHIDDLAELIERVVREPARFRGQTFNVGGGLANSVSLCELTDRVAQVCGTAIEIGHEAQARAADIPLYISDTARLEAGCGWKPRKTVDDILTDTHRWIVSHHDLLRPILA